jgi:hypothetical protein
MLHEYYVTYSVHYYHLLFYITTIQLGKFTHGYGGTTVYGNTVKPVLSGTAGDRKIVPLKQVSV